MDIHKIMRSEKPIKIKPPENKESFLNKNWLFVRNAGGGFHVERTTAPIGYVNSEDGESWIAPGSYVAEHPAVKESGYTDEALKTAVEDWIQSGAAEEKLAA